MLTLAMAETGQLYPTYDRLKHNFETKAAFAKWGGIKFGAFSPEHREDCAKIQRGLRTFSPRLLLRQRMTNSTKPRKGTRSWGSSASVTLHQVAQRAGVHPMTVSRALKGSSKVAPETRENIERIAKELNYTPNLMARALVSGRTGTIAVVTGPVNEYYYAHLLHLLEIELEASDYKMLFLRSRDLRRDLLSVVNASAVDGIIAVDTFFDVQDLVYAQSMSIPPFVYVGAIEPAWGASVPIDTIRVDLRQGVREALQAMLSTGCRRVAYLTANEHMARPEEVRTGTYLSTLEDGGRPHEIINLEVGGNTGNRALIRSKLVEYIQAHGHPDGLLCQNDEMAIAAYRALRDLGLRVPDQVQLVGCDGLPYMEYFDPQLSTIIQPAEEMCALAWQFLQNRIQTPDAPRQAALLEAHFSPRASLKDSGNADAA